ncbi:hypothetical protein ACFRIC_15385 [Streptomyces sp. NPDC056738]|uniref:hypothetical protein n=1 Tax=Streptomyces sp. NPDC056738 TaxID=3345933 RepID=UPI00369D5310
MAREPGTTGRQGDGDLGGQTDGDGQGDGDLGGWDLRAAHSTNPPTVKRTEHS